MREAGLEKYLYIDWFRDHPIDDDLKIFRWSETKLGGAAHVDWKSFDHPELGKVEIGGWNRIPCSAIRRWCCSSASWRASEVARLAGTAVAEARAVAAVARAALETPGLCGWS
jgi:hypothetical protein